MDGKPLYDQSLFPSFSPHVAGVLAQLARALQEIHALGAIHRDVKGDNILVRYSDGRALLMDLGSCHYPGASTLTPPATHPGTPLYRAPESWGHELNRDRSQQFRAQAADDLFALGLTACRLVSGEYPQLSAPRRDEHGRWHVDAVTAPAALRDKRINPRLRACILRLLSVRPVERGTAAELAETLEQLAAPRPGDAPAPRSSQVPSLARPPEETAVAAPGPRVSTRRRRPWLLLAAVTVAVGAWWVGTRRTVDTPHLGHTEAAPAGQSKAEATGLGEAATSTAAAASLHEPEGLAQDTLPEPLPEQVRPDSKGRCPHKKQVALNGGCWVEMPLDRDTCEAALSGHMFKNKCYMPAPLHGRQPNSGPTTPP
ncbi:MAG: serine/threonine protein kinase [Hyalangium sp.]